MHITELAKKLDVDARELDKSLLVREYTDYGIVPDEIAESLLYLYEYYSSQLITPKRGESIELSFCLKPCIYFLFDGHSITYIGKSLNLLDRIAQHSKGKEFNGIAIIEVPRKDLDILELFYISKFLPRDNKADLWAMSKIIKLINKI